MDKATITLVANMFEKQSELLLTQAKALRDHIDNNTTSSITTTNIETETKKKTKKEKPDPNKPKRPPTGYTLFLTEVIAKYKSDHPEMDPKMVMIEIAKRWSAMDPEEKKEYTDRAAKVKEVYVDNMKAYQQSLEDGTTFHPQEQTSPVEVDSPIAFTNSEKKKKKKRKHSSHHDSSESVGTDENHATTSMSSEKKKKVTKIS